MIETNPDALREAAARDAERAQGKLRGPLHGIPVLIKDNIDATRRNCRKNIWNNRPIRSWAKTNR